MSRLGTYRKIQNDLEVYRYHQQSLIFHISKRGFERKNQWVVIWSTCHSTLRVPTCFLINDVFRGDEDFISSFETNHESTHFSTSKSGECRSPNPCSIDRNKWRFGGATSGEYGGWRSTTQFNSSEFPRQLLRCGPTHYHVVVMSLGQFRAFCGQSTVQTGCLLSVASNINRFTGIDKFIINNAPMFRQTQPCLLSETIWSCSRY